MARRVSHGGEMGNRMERLISHGEKVSRGEMGLQWRDCSLHEEMGPL